MKKILIITSLLLSSTTVVPSNIHDKPIEQSSDSKAPVEAYQAIDELDYEKLASILAVTGSLSKEAKGLPLLTLHKLRDNIFTVGCIFRLKLLRDSKTFDVKVFGLISLAALSLTGGTFAGLNALCLPGLTVSNRLLFGVASLGCLALCSYTTYMLAQKNHKKNADMNALIEPFNQKLAVILCMIALLENHPES